jgi:hypothetical protein
MLHIVPRFDRLGGFALRLPTGIAAKGTGERYERGAYCGIDYSFLLFTLGLACATLVDVRGFLLAFELAWERAVPVSEPPTV